MTKVYIKELNIISFGHFVDKKITLNPSFNLIYGKNESGKSTISDFIEGILYGFDDGNKIKHFSYKKEKYRPKDSYKYTGNIVFVKDNNEIRVNRNFDDGSYSIINETRNIEVEVKKSDLNFPGKYILNMSYDLYRTLIDNYQRQAIEKNSRELLMDKLNNLDGDFNFSYKKAIENIDNNLNEIGSQRAYTKEYAKTLNKLKDIDLAISRIKNLKTTYRKDISDLYRQRNEIKDLEENLNQLKITRSDFLNSRASKNYLEEQRQKEKLKEIEDKIYEYGRYKNFDFKFFDKIDLLIDTRNELIKKDGNNNQIDKKVILLLISLLIIFVSYLNRKLILLPLLIIPISLYFFLKKSNFNELSLIEKSINRIFIENNIKNEYDYREIKKSYIEYDKLINEKYKINEILEILSKQDKLEKNVEIEAKYINIELIDAEIFYKEEKLNKLNKENLEYEKKLASIENELSKEVSLLEEYKFLKNKIDNLNTEVEANRLAREIILSLQKNKSKNFNLDSEISEIISQISKKKYRKIIYDNNLNPKIEKSSGDYIELEKLSRGFIDQLNFALKFTFNNKLNEDKFVIYDDAFINYDQERLRNTIFYLLDISKSFQIIYLTCHNREEEILNSELIDVNLINLGDK